MKQLKIELNPPSQASWLEGSRNLANPTQAQESDLEKRTNAIYGPKCLEQFREIQPRWIVGENVLGLTNWNGGLVFEEVCADLEAQGYEVQPFVLPAASVNAPHRRDRVWFVAHSNGGNDRRTPRQDEGEGGKERLQERNSVRQFTQSSEVFGATADPPSKRDTSSRKSREAEGNGRENNGEQEFRGKHTEWYNGLDAMERNASNTSSERLQRRDEQSKREITEAHRTKEFSKPTSWEEFPTKPPIRLRNDGVSRGLDTSSISENKWRNESIKAYGNAVVPQVVYQIFKAINEYESQGKH